MAKTTRTTTIMQQIQNLSAEEQGNLINAMRLLEVNAQDEQYFTNVTKAMQAAGWNPLKRAVAGVKAAMRNKMEATKGINSRKTARVMRLFGMRKTADFMDRWLTGAPKKKFKEIKTPKAEEPSTTTKSDGSGTAKALLSMKTQLNDIQMGVTDVGEDVSDIKSLLMPKFFTAKGKKGTEDAGDSQIGMYNPLAPVGSQFNKLSEKGVLQGKPGKNFKSSAEQKAALETAKLALKIREKDQAKVELKKKYTYKDEEEKAEEKDKFDELKEYIDGRFDKLEKEMPSEKKGFLGMLSSLTPFLMPILAAIAKLGLAGLALWIGKKIGDWIYEKYGMKIQEGLDWIRKKVDSIKLWWDSLDDKFIEFAKNLSGKMRSGLEKLGIIKSEEEYAAERAAIEAKQRSGELPPGKAPPGFHYEGNKLVADNPNAPKYNQAQLDAFAKLAAQQRAQAAVETDPAKKAAMETNAAKFEQMAGVQQQTIPAEVADTDTVDTNYPNVPVAPPVPTAPAPKPMPSVPAVGGTGTLTTSTYEQRVKELGDVIAKGESKGNYNVYNMGKGHGYKQRKDEDLSKMTIAEFLRRGNLPLKDPNKMFATGKYQIIPDTMADAVKKLGLNVNSTLTPEMQEYIFREYLTKSRRPKIHDYLTGKSSDFKAAVTEMAKEWASVGVPEAMQGANRWVQAGESYYAGDGINKAHTSADTIASTLTPASSLPGSTTDSLSRQHQAFNSPVSASVFGMPPIVNSTQINNTTVGKRPAAKADVLTQDNAFVRALSKDVQHPTFG